MAAKHTGGAAFPAKRLRGGQENGSGLFVLEQGMTLRDYFAGRALAGFCSNPNNGPSNRADFPKVAYALADAMLKEREY